MSYAATRRLIAAGGFAVLLLLAAILYFRRVDSVEVFAVLLFLPVFLALVMWRLPGGAIAGVLAATGYVAMRLDAIDAIGAERFVGLIATRAIGYIAFGIIGGWAVRQLDSSLEKLDIYDQIDDETGLYNARFFLQETDLEMARATRYKTLFSVAVVDVPAGPIDGLGRRKRAGVMTELGRAMQAAVRSVDRAVHGRVGDVHRFGVICPETGPEGAQVFTSRLASQLSGFLAARGISVAPSALNPVAATFPGDDAVLARLRSDFAQVEQAQHPEHPTHA